MPRISIIITNYNGINYLRNCIASLKNSSFLDFEIIIVDNGSSDNSVDFIRKNYPEVKILELGTNSGLAIASNRGRELSQGRYLFFYNNDTIAEKEMLAELIRVMESDPKIGICGCKTLTYDGRREINCGVEMDIFGYPYGKGRPFYVDAAIFIRKDVFDEIGGFDEKMFLYCEDRDICWRTRLYGYKVVAVDSAVFRHDSVCLAGGGQFNTNIGRRFMSEAFTLRMLLKNYGFLSLVMLLPLYFLINFVEMFIFIIKGELEIILKSYLSAYFWNLKNLQDTLAKRKTVQKGRKISDVQLIKELLKTSGKFLLFKDAGIPKIRDIEKSLNLNN